jgi:hypothetical protein
MVDGNTGFAPEAARLAAIAACSTALPDHIEAMFVLPPEAGLRSLQ